jgi:hypothetical protein
MTDSLLCADKFEPIHLNGRSMTFERSLNEKRGKPMLGRPDTSVGPIIADFGKRATILGCPDLLFRRGDQTVAHLTPKRFAL